LRGITHLPRKAGEKSTLEAGGGTRRRQERTVKIEKLTGKNLRKKKNYGSESQSNSLDAKGKHLRVILGGTL
jgi:hypothetical protein